MAITYTLPGFKLVNQNNEPTSDGYPDENHDWNCVPASIAAGLMYLTGDSYNGDQLKDAVYGPGYHGGQAARAYVAYCAARGVDLVAYDNASGAALVAYIHSELRAGHPVLVSMPSQWGTPQADPLHPSGSTHVGIACGYGDGMIRVMNPWGGFWHDGTDAYWAPRLVYGEVWSMRKRATQGGTTAMGFVKQTDGSGKDAHGNHCGPGVMAKIETDKLTANGRRSETYQAGLAPVVAFITLEDGHVLTWDGHTVGYDGASVVEGFARAHDNDLHTMTDQAQQITALHAELAQRDNELKAATDHAAALQAQVDALTAQLAAANATAAAAANATAALAALSDLKATLAKLP